MKKSGNWVYAISSVLLLSIVLFAAFSKSQAEADAERVFRALTAGVPADVKTGESVTTVLTNVNPKTNSQSLTLQRLVNGMPHVMRVEDGVLREGYLLDGETKKLHWVYGQPDPHNYHDKWCALHPLWLRELVVR